MPAGRISQPPRVTLERPPSDAEVLGEVPRLEIVLHAREEPRSELAVDRPVIPRHRDVDHAAYRNRVVDHDWPFDDRVERQDPGVRLIDDRYRRDRAVGARVRDRERSALYLVGLQL